jgi:hypothetical protein
MARQPNVSANQPSVRGRGLKASQETTKKAELNPAYQAATCVNDPDLNDCDQDDLAEMHCDMAQRC